MRAAILCLALVAVKATTNEYDGISGQWYSSGAEWTAGHFPRSGETAKVPAGASVVFTEADEPTLYAETTQGTEVDNWGEIEIGPGSELEIGVAANAPVNCDLGGWSGYDTCTADCDGGTQTRSRSYVEPAYGGDECGEDIFPSGHSCTLASGQIKCQQTCNPQACAQLCSHTTCRFGFERGAWRTIVQHERCAETNGNDFHCKHFHSTQTMPIFATGSASHTDECKCYCSGEGTSKITHTHWDSDDTSRANAGVEKTHVVGNNVLNTCQDYLGQVMQWCGKVSQHRSPGGPWTTDSDGLSGCWDSSTHGHWDGVALDSASRTPLNYCKKFFPTATKAVSIGDVETNTWCNQGNTACGMTSTKPAFNCVA